MKNYFKGRYYKHQKDNNTIAIIVGKASTGEFLQIITPEEVLQYEDMSKCHISKNGLCLNYPAIKGQILYGNFLPLRYSIMGPFRYLPMQCYHEVISMRHAINGSLTIHGQQKNFNGGTGYIEGDYGHSFPKEYLWLQCNDFEEDLSIMVSIAHIPFCGLQFTGCICAITYNGKEYRLATYKGVRIKVQRETHLVLSQGRYRLDIRLKPAKALPLRSPKKGRMTGCIKESNCTMASFHFSSNKNTIFRTKSKNCSYEYNY